jgi:Zn-dependent M32 family carboxypeptidase
MNRPQLDSVIDVNKKVVEVTKAEEVHCDAYVSAFDFYELKAVVFTLKEQVRELTLEVEGKLDSSETTQQNQRKLIKKLMQQNCQLLSLLDRHLHAKL